MKLTLIVLLLLVLAACDPAPGHHMTSTETSLLETSGGLMVLPTKIIL